MRVGAATNVFGRQGTASSALAPTAGAAGAVGGRIRRQPDSAGAGPHRMDDLSADERRLIQSLRSRDQQVRAHELAHQAAGGPYAGAASFTYRKGPNGGQYAVAGEVDVSLQRTGDPKSDLRMAEAVRSAALAPAEPSAQDRSVAAEAAAIASEARLALQSAPRAGGTGTTGGAGASRRVEGEYIDRSGGAQGAGLGDSPQTARFMAVQRMGAAEFMAVGGRLNLFA